MCQPGGSQRMWGGERCNCGCCGCGCGGGMFSRRFISKREELERLEEYRDQLKKELEGVTEHIQELKGK